MSKGIWIFVVALTLLTILAQYQPGHGGEEHAYDKVPLFWGIFGMLAAALLIGLARLIGPRLIERKEDYYNER